MKLPKEVIKLLNDPEATKVLTSVSADGIPHTIVVASTMAPQEDLICAGEVFMETTSNNFRENENVAVLAVKGLESYQVIGKVKSRETEGAIYDTVSAELAKLKLPCHAVWIFEPLEAYNQGAGPDTGKKIA